MSSADGSATSSHADVVIVGAGLSGLTCAAYLVRHGVAADKIQVLESRDRVGGRCHTAHGDGGRWSDLGAGYVGPTQDRILRVARDVGIETFRVHGDTLPGKHGLLVFPSVGLRTALYSSTPLILNPFVLLDLNAAVVATDAVAAGIDRGAPHESPGAVELDAMTVSDWLGRHVWTRTVKELYAGVVRTAMTAEASQVSMLYWAWYVQCAGGTYRLTDSDNGAQERKFKGGTQGISTALAERLTKQGVHILTGRRVCRMATGSDDEVVQVLHASPHCSSGSESASGSGRSSGSGSGSGTPSVSTCRAQYAVVAVPPPMYGDDTGRRPGTPIAFDPPLSALRRELCAGYATGEQGSGCIKTMTFYETAWWHERGFNGNAVCGTDAGPLCGTIDDCKEGGKFPALVGFIEGTAARTWSQRSKEDRRAAVIAQLHRVLGDGVDPASLAPVDYVEKDWTVDEHSSGVCVAMTVPGVLAKAGTELRKPIGRTHFASTETAHVWVGYMDGAVNAGERAAFEVLQRLVASGTPGARLPKGSSPLAWDREPSDPVVVARPSGPSWLERHAPGVVTLAVLCAVGVAAAATLYAGML